MSFYGSLRHSVLALGILCLAINAAHATGTSCAGGHTDRMRINGKVENSLVLSLSDLQNYPPSSIEVTYFSGANGLVKRSFTGVWLSELLKTAVVETDPAIKNDIIRKYVVVVGSDCYETVLAVADLLPEYGGQPIMVAYADGDGIPLFEEGFAKLVIPGDKRASRYVSNIVRITVRSAP
jgi:DMSO/TMAO reductase YedYZ molybdopterin-dependent catalytic subunit